MTGKNTTSGKILSVSILLIVCAIIASAAFVAIGRVLGAPLPTASYGFISGNVSIGPFCPVERVNGTCSITPSDVYSSRSLVLSPALGSAIYIRLQSDGSFYSQVASGTYSVSLTNCTFLGCSRALPQTVVIAQGRATSMQINIDTGIR